MIGELVSDIDDHEKLGSTLEFLGRKHESLGIPKQYLEAMGPVFYHTIRPVLQSFSSTESPGSTSLWRRDTKPAWLRFFRVIALQMKRGYRGQLSFDDQRSISLETSESFSPSHSSQVCSFGNQYLLLQHPSADGTTKKRLARQKMTTSIASATNSNSVGAVISDSHAHRKAMFLKQYNKYYKRRISVDDQVDQPQPTAYQTRRDGSILHMGSTFCESSDYLATQYSRLRELRRGSSCEMSGANPFYHRARRRSDDSMKKKLSLDNHLTLYT